MKKHNARTLIAVLILIVTLNSCNSKKSDEVLKYSKIVDYYNSIIPPEFPKFEFSEENSIVVWNSPSTNSYVINSDTIYSDPDNDRSGIVLEIMSRKTPEIYSFRSADSLVGFVFVNSDINLRTGKEYNQMNIFGSKYHLTGTGNSELNYLPVIIHEMAHMTELPFIEEEKQLIGLDISMVPLIIHFDSDSTFRENIIEENNFLLSALEATEEEVPLILTNYFLAQEKRKKSSPDSLMIMEPSVEASEGYGRYMEYLCKKDLDSLKLSELTGFTINVPDYKLSNEKYMFDVSLGNGYMYVTGFNKIRLLMKYEHTDFLDIYRGLKPVNLDPYLKEMIKRS